MNLAMFHKGRQKNEAKAHCGLQMSERSDGHAIKHVCPSEPTKLEPS